ncbi:isoprenyl transferase [Akkermansia muciniphila]|uniref:isoprenyl transferase n=1 Tax=Akkermansia muciniphila TaxID=239935 RepID=UPI001BFF23B0|nr:isoprenyl transferase [Akkermansia muciniphila]MBT8777594.1 isoprenyl transferase [Akkermansia muciniphila]
MLTIPKEKLPVHIACIMDGNGRWAHSRHLPRQAGHRAGADTVEHCVDFCIDHGIPWLTLYAFSSENWNRPKMEVHALMVLLHEFLKKRLGQMQEKGVRLRAIGDISRLPKRTQKLLQSSMEATRENTRLNLVLALSYGSRAEITAAARKIAEKAARGEIHPDQVTEDLFNQHLDTAGMPEPDLLIRTSGEMRVSNFLLWQISYSELYVTDTLWPDFSDRDMEAALLDYSRRKRRFGAL